MPLIFSNVAVPPGGAVIYNNVAAQKVVIHNVEVWQHGYNVNNLVVNSGFLQGTTGWSTSGDGWVDNQGFGGSSKSWYSQTVGNIGFAKQAWNIAGGHIMYMRASGHCTVTPQQNVKIHTENWASSWLLQYDTTDWVTVSNRFQTTTTGTYTMEVGLHWQHVGHACNTTSILLVDLTQAFGAGKEPSQATCDSWPWWDGTTLIII